MTKRVSLTRRTLLAQVSSRNAAEEALLSSFVGGKRLEVSASLKRVQFQVLESA